MQKLKFIITGIAILTIGFILGIAFHQAITPNEPAIHSSIALNHAQATQFLQARIKALHWPDAQGKTYTLTPSPTANNNITLIGQTPFELYDDHGKTTFILTDIHDNKAYITMQSHFDHHSFGQNMQTIKTQLVILDVAELQ
jgi:hypothetical protein